VETTYEDQPEEAENPENDEPLGNNDPRDWAQAMATRAKTQLRKKKTCPTDYGQLDTAAKKR